MEEENKAKALALVEAAKECVRKKEYEHALDLYSQGLEYFIDLMNNASTKNEENELLKKCDEYLSRAEDIKAFLETGAKRQQSAKRQQVPKQTSSSSSAGSVLMQKRKDLADQIRACILNDETKVEMKDVVGLDEVKKTFIETVQLAKKFPKTMAERGLKNGILLYGPPGTGKTHLAKALASYVGCTFFNVRASDLSSKWHGEPEILVKLLFEIAREEENAILFLDECESFCSTRDESDRDSANKVKAEMLTQMQGLGTKNSNLLIVGATNLPHSLDEAFKRRFSKFIEVPLPNENARELLFRYEVSKVHHELSAENFANLAKSTKGFSNSDITNIAKEARGNPPKEALYATHFKPDGLYMTPCSSEDDGAQAVESGNFNYTEDQIKFPPVTYKHFEDAMKGAMPSVTQATLAALEKFKNQERTTLTL